MSHLEPEAKIFACSQSVYLAEKIRTIRIPLGKVTMSKYSDGEFQPSYEESIRGYVYLLFVPLFQIQIRWNCY
jgi:ribose-phosphate pyrophosphokinase